MFGEVFLCRVTSVSRFGTLDVTFNGISDLKVVSLIRLPLKHRTHAVMHERPVHILARRP